MRDGIFCQCVDKHVPLPNVMEHVKVGDELVALCPTTHANVKSLLTEYNMYGTVPPGSVTKHYSKYVRELCFTLWEEKQTV